MLKLRFVQWDYILSIGLVGLLLLLPWQTHYLLQTGTTEFTQLKLYCFDIWFGIVLVLWGIKSRYGDSKQKSLTPVVYWGIVFWMMVGVAAYWSSHWDISFYYWLRVGQGLLLWQIITNLPQRYHVWLWSALLVTGVIESVVIFWQWSAQAIPAAKWLGLSLHTPETSGVAVVITNVGRFLRPYGTLPHPNITGGWLTIATLVGIYHWLTLTHPTQRWQRALATSATLICLAGLLMTFSRSAIVVLLFCLGGWCITSWRKLWPLLLACGGVLVLTCLLFYPLWFARVQAVSYVEQYSSQERLNQLHQAFTVIQEKWYSGTGPGTYTEYVPTTGVAIAQPVHVWPVLLLAETGIFGMLAWLVFTGYVLYSAKNDLMIPLLPLLLAPLLLGFFDHYFWTSPSMGLLWYGLLGLSLKNSNIRQKNTG